MKTTDRTDRGWLFIRAATVAILVVGRLAATDVPAAQAQARAGQAAQQLERPAAIRETPPEMEARYAATKTALQPSARIWIEQQARIEGQKPDPDVAAVEAAVRARFGNSQMSAAASRPTPEAASATRAAAGSSTPQPIGGLGQGDISEMVFLVLMQASKDADSDLKQIMAEVKAEAAAKQKLRDLMSQAGKEVAANAASNNNKNLAAAPCNTPACRSLAEGAMQLSAMTAQSKHPLRYNVSSQMSNAQARQTLDKMKQDLDSMNEMGETESLRLQMAMDRRSKFLDTISNVMKKMDATSSSVVQNLK